MFVPSGQSLDSIGGSSAPSMPIAALANMGSPIADPTRGADSQSIRSLHSMSSIANPSISHPQMHQPGLNASVVETVSATFTQTRISKAVVIGEMALQHNALDGANMSGTEHVRLDNFPVLEKVAPNPTFINHKPATSGEYIVNLSDIPRPTVAFKYQIHLEDSNLSAHAPISITPSWKIEPTQTSVIVTYDLNPEFAFPEERRSVLLKNLIIFVTIENAKAQSCQSKPAAIFSKEKSLIYWKLGDVTLESNAGSPQKLLARFATDGEARAGTVEARWEITGEQATGLGSRLGLSANSTSVEKDESGSSDPFADESPEKNLTGTTSAASGWKVVPVTRRIVSGRYLAI